MTNVTYSVVMRSRFNIGNKFRIRETKFIARYDRILLQKKPEKAVLLLGQRLSVLLGTAIVPHADGNMKGVKSLDEDNDQAFNKGAASDTGTGIKDREPVTGAHPQTGPGETISSATIFSWTSAMVEAEGLSVVSAIWRLRRVVSAKKSKKLITQAYREHIEEYSKQRKAYNAKRENDRNAHADDKKLGVSGGIPEAASGPTS